MSKTADRPLGSGDRHYGACVLRRVVAALCRQMELRSNPSRVVSKACAPAEPAPRMCDEPPRRGPDSDRVRPVLTDSEVPSAPAPARSARIAAMKRLQNHAVRHEKAYDSRNLCAIGRSAGVARARHGFQRFPELPQGFRGAFRKTLHQSARPTGGSADAADASDRSRVASLSGYNVSATNLAGAQFDRPERREGHGTHSRGRHR
jgi:hypothetical protein